MVRIRTADNSTIVGIDIVDSTWGVEKGVTIDRKRAAMDTVGPGLKLILEDTLPKPILGGEGALQHGEFPDQVKRRIDEILAALKFGEGDGYSVENHFVLKIQSTIDATVSRYSRCQPSINAPDGRYSRRR